MEADVASVVGGASNPFGVCLPLFTLIANGIRLRHGDGAALRLARR